MAGETNLKDAAVTQESPDGRDQMPRTATRRRRDLLVGELRYGRANISELAGRFAVSASTIRRDLAALAHDGRVVRTYGGAVEPGHGGELSLRAKEQTHWAEKDIVGWTAAGMVGRGDVLLLDAGTTVGRLAWHLRQLDGITVITNGLSALLNLADAPRVEVIVLGGRLRRPNEALLGPEVERALRRYRPDLAFLGADGLEPGRGLNCPSPEQAILKELMATTARETWVVADHWKLGVGPFAYWAAMPPGTGVITDPDCPPAALRMFEKHGWRTAVSSGQPAPPPGADQN